MGDRTQGASWNRRDVSNQSHHFVTIVIPALNEEAHITTCVTTLIKQMDDFDGEVMVVDGGSSDFTRNIVLELMLMHPRLRLIDNNKKLQSAACNMAANLADPRATVLLRADAHALYPDNFVKLCLHALQASGATSVVVPMHTIGHTGFQRAVASAQNSRLGNGGSTHRNGGISDFIDHGHHAAFSLAFFHRIGGYNENFSHNEDAELDFRANRMGGRVWMCREAAITYIPRSTPVALTRQYLRHGAGRARTLLLHSIRPRPRQLAPLAVFVTMVSCIVMAPIFPFILTIPLVYILICIGWGFLVAIGENDKWLMAMGPAAIIMHLSWAIGFLREAVWQGIQKKSMVQPRDITI